ncbi:MAG: 4-alpha-glucanotransferase [Myxococcota bacterium]
MDDGNLHLFPRSAGIVLHPTSLPGPHGIGDLGAEARRFVDWLASAGISRWQILPLVPPGAGFSPYSSPASLAGNPWLLDLDDLRSLGLLDPSDLEAPGFPPDAVDPASLAAFKGPALWKASHRLYEDRALRSALEDWRAREPWVEEMARFAAIHERQGDAPWWEWPAGLRHHDADAIAAFEAEYGDEVAHQVALQFLFDRQWHALRDHAAERGVTIIGDIPIYVNLDSVDVWADREQFRIDDDGNPEAVAGVPPDYFSETGQLWGNPLYDWERMAADGYAWWIGRLKRILEQVDLVRIDHFRAFSTYWEVPPNAPDARGGRWREGPGEAFFDAIEEALGDVPVIAEDLGMLSPDVHELRDAVGLPGMKILQFAFGGEADNLYLPHNHPEHAIVYSGTHDNDTTVGWWETSPRHVRDHVRRYLATDGSGIAWTLVRTALASVAHTAIVPLQDVLGLGSDARMNVPGRADGNWLWRVRAEAFNEDVAAALRELVELYGRD